MYVNNVHKMQPTAFQGWHVRVKGSDVKKVGVLGPTDLCENHGVLQWLRTRKGSIGWGRVDRESRFL